MNFRGLAKEYAFYLNLLARVLDSLLLFIASWISYYIKFKTSLLLDAEYSAVVLVHVVLCAILFPAYGVYHSWRGKNLVDQLFLLLKAWAFSYLILVLIGTLTKTSALFSREWLIDWAMLSAVLLLASKLFIYRLMQLIRKQGNNERSVVFVGSAKSIKQVKRRIKHAEWAGFKSVAWVSVYDSDQGQVLQLDHVHGLDKLEQVVEKYQPDELWVVSPISDLDICKQVNRLLSNHTVNIRYIPDLRETALLDCPSSNFLGMLTWDISVSPFTESKRLIKSLEDRLLALLILTIISPLMFLIAIGVKISSPGPVFFKQERHGWDGKIIKVYKFRSMKIHQEAAGKVTQATQNDARTTKFGAFLRRTSLDELPQFFNVLQGRMSIVGPRPHAVSHNEQFCELIEEYMRRHKVKPGITGWAQVNGWRGETDTLEKMKNRVKYDFYYIRNWSLWLDLKIILMTVLRTFVDKNAY